MVTRTNWKQFTPKDGISKKSSDSSVALSDYVAGWTT
jgi:hypothetical protein